MAELSFLVFSNFKDHGIKAITYPSDGAMLNRQVGALVEVIRMKEHLLRFFKADSAPWIPPKAFALPRIKVESHDGITVIPSCEAKRKGLGSSPAFIVSSAGLGPRLAPVSTAGAMSEATHARVMYTF